MSHGSFLPFDPVAPNGDLDVRGLWYVGRRGAHLDPQYYGYAFCLSAIPPAWARANGLGDRMLLSAGAREGMLLGPGMTAVRAWNADGSYPESGAELDCVTLVQYSAGNDGLDAFEGYVKTDNWRGAAWISAGNRHAAVLAGQKAYGYYYYGYIDGTKLEEGSHAVPRIEAAADKGWIRTSGRPMLLFYDPSDLAAVASGRMARDKPKPYTALDLNRYMLRPIPDVEYGWSLNPRLQAMTFDAARGFLFVVESRAYASSGTTPLDDVVHVFKAN